MAKFILVVDDEQIVTEISKRKLQEWGYEVATAGDGVEAMQVLKKRIPDLIVLDIQMPRMNGYTFVVEKSKIPEYANIPVIVLTAYGEMEPLMKRHGIQTYLFKPLKLQELQKQIEAILGNKPL